MASRSKIEKNIQRIGENIAAACARAKREPGDVRIVAVTKTVGLEEIKAVVDLGLADLGESRVQQLLERSAELSGAMARRRNGSAAPVRWHMIGHLQRNKVKAVLDAGVEIIHSVDTLRLAEDINVRAQKMNKTIDLLMEVNCSQEPQKFGVAVGATAYLCEMISTLKNVRLVGLMTMAPQVRDPEQARPTFVRLRELFEEIRHDRHCGEAFKHLSMGMSQDYAIAVEEGATMLRIGTALFS
jgi:pyridoxal phosphate enzyme (YggS family)